MYDSLVQYSWQAKSMPSGYYACRSTCSREEGYASLMHREILCLHRGDGFHTDHINHNTLDNRIRNLRACSCHENNCNRLSRKNTSSQFKGVWKSGKKWEAGIRNHGKRIYLGRYTVEADAAKAYDDKAVELFRDFAYLNFPQPVCHVSPNLAAVAAYFLTGE